MDLLLGVVTALLETLGTHYYDNKQQIRAAQISFFDRYDLPNLDMASGPSGGDPKAQKCISTVRSAAMS